MSKAQKQSSRDARNAAQRAIQSIKTNAEPSTETLTASVAALTKRLDDITTAMEVDDEDPPPPLQPAMKKAPKYSIKMTQRSGPQAIQPPTAEFYVDAAGKPTHQKK